MTVYFVQAKKLIGYREKDSEQVEVRLALAVSDEGGKIIEAWEA